MWSWLLGVDRGVPIGGSKVLRQSDTDVATVIGAGLTVFEALKAYDQLKADGISIRVSEAVAAAGFTVHRLAVREIPHSGTPDELVDHYGISARHVVEAVKSGARS